MINRRGKRFFVISLALLLVLSIIPQTVARAAGMDVVFDGAVSLSPGNSFQVKAYNPGGETYTVDEGTPLGVLHAVATQKSITYDVTDKNYEASGALLLDNIGNYTYVKGGARWHSYVNGVLEDGFNNPEGALNLIELNEGDKVEFYFAAVPNASDLDAVKVNAVAAIKTVVSLEEQSSIVDVDKPSDKSDDPGKIIPAKDWVLNLFGEIGDTITQEEFETKLAASSSDYYREWVDKDGKVWSGIPLWVLVSAVDDIERGSSWTFNEELSKEGYTVEVAAEDGYTKTFQSTDIAKSDDYIIANQIDGVALVDAWPLRLVGDGVAKDDGSLSGFAVGNIVSITIPEMLTPPAEDGSWNLALKGIITDVLSQTEFEEGLGCHRAEWTDDEDNVWSGIPLWYLTGWVDDRQPHNFNFNQADAGYTILVRAEDGYTKEFSSKDVAKSNDYILADKLNGEALTLQWPLRLVGSGVAREDGSLSSSAVGQIVEIELVDFGKTRPVPELRIVKYDEDQVTIIDEIIVDHVWMEANLPVIGDGETIYRYEGITNDPDDVWDAAETYPGGFKLHNAIKGTRVSDLCDLVGGMGSGTEIVFVAKDGYETRLPYSSIYPDPAVYARQGDAILAWWGDGAYVPDYKDGIRLFFTPEDKIYSQWDMHETLPEQYWHFYYGDLTQYPSCAGLSPKYITEVRVFSVPVSDWTLSLDGSDLGGLHEDISKTYFEQALVCQFGADHKASYTDNKGRKWEGIPLWLMAGFVDDVDKHSSDAFNVELAEAGYEIVLTAADGYQVTISSQDIIKNNDYIVANTVDGVAIPQSDKNWPLRLVGAGVSGSSSIGNIVSIELLKSQGLTDILDHWARENIEYLVELGAVMGYPDRTFKPDGDITRAEFVSVLVKALEIESGEHKQFDDITGHWAEELIMTAASSSIIEGYGDGIFGPDDEVTREQMAVMIVRALELKLEVVDTDFADQESISEWAKTAVSVAVEKGIVNGYPDNTFAPQANATRAEAVTMIVNALDQ